MKALLTLHAALIAVAATLLEVATCTHAMHYFKMIKERPRCRLLQHCSIVEAFKRQLPARINEGSPCMRPSPPW